MELEEHKGTGLTYLTIEPDGYTPGGRYPMIILLHGFGANMRDLAGICPYIDAEAYIYACPNAPMAMHLGLGGEGFAWAPLGGDGAGESADHAEELLSDFFDEVMDLYNVEPGQAVIGGFSQGGTMAYRCGLTKPDRFRGLVALSSSVPRGDSWRARLGAKRDMAIFVAQGTSDTLVPVEDARQAVESLNAEGYLPEYHEYEMGHEITQGVLDDLRLWIHRTLPPAGP